jgi:hypothetical protein
MKGMPTRKKDTPHGRECLLGKRTPHMEGMPTRKKDTPHGRNDKEEEGHPTWKE